MKHTLDQLIALSYRHFARGPGLDREEYEQSSEHRARQEAHDRASADYPRWRAMLLRLKDRFPKDQLPEVAVENRSPFLQSPGGTPWDRCFSACIWLPARLPGEADHMLGFLVSFVVPYYVVYSSHVGPEAEGARQKISFELSAEEVPFAGAVVKEIEATFPGYAPMPPEVGEVVVPGLSENSRCPGEGRIFDCLFSENW